MRQQFQENLEENPPALVLQTESIAQAEESTLEVQSSLAPAVRKGVRDYRWQMFCGILFGGVTTGVVVSVIATLIQYGNPFLTGLFVLLLSIAAASMLRYSFKRAKDNIKMVAKTDDFEALGAMIDMLELEKELKVFDATVSITNILSNIRPEHAEVLTPRHRCILRHILTRSVDGILRQDLSLYLRSKSQQAEEHRRYLELQVAIMKGFAQVGTEAEVSAVERWATIEAKSEAQQLLKSTAMECLPVLKERAAQLSDQKTLLRASDANHHDPRFLLRPSRDTAEPTEQLLRPNETLP